MIITSKYYKPAFPLQLDDDYIYPKTTADQVIADETSNLQEIIDQLRRSVIIQYTHSSSGLTSSTPTAVENGKFKAYDTMDISSIDINGTTYNVNSGTIKITKDSWYMFLLDFTNQTIHFLSSSGVSSEDLSAFYITYNTNGGTLPLSAVTNFGQATPSFMLPEPTKTGYTFEGWYTYEDFSGDEVTQVMQGTTTNLTFYAKWKVNSYTYNIVYKSSSGIQLGTATATYDYGTTNTISPKVFTGYTSPSDQSIKWDSTGVKTITFTYTPITYTITYNLNSGTQGSGAVTSYTIETATFNLPTPTRTYYTFIGWYTNSSFTDSIIKQIPKGSYGNKTFYAKWEVTSKIIIPNPTAYPASAWVTRLYKESDCTPTLTVDNSKFYMSIYATNNRWFDAALTFATNGHKYLNITYSTTSTNKYYRTLFEVYNASGVKIKEVIDHQNEVSNVNNATLKLDVSGNSTIKIYIYLYVPDGQKRTFTITNCRLTDV